MPKQRKHIEDKEIQEVDKSYLEAVKINKDRLDDECIRFPGDYCYFADLETEWSEKKDSLATLLDMQKAEVELKIRSIPLEDLNIKYNVQLKNLTEATIQALIKLTKEVAELQQQYLEAKYFASIYYTARRSMERKENMLQLLEKIMSREWNVKSAIKAGESSAYNAAYRKMQKKYEGG